MKHIPVKYYAWFLIVSIVFLCLCSKGYGQQVFPSGNPTSQSWIKGGQKVDSAFVLPWRKSAWPWQDSTGRICYDRYGDSSIYYHNGIQWIKIGSGSGADSSIFATVYDVDTAKQNIRDTRIWYFPNGTESINYATNDIITIGNSWQFTVDGDDGHYNFSALTSSTAGVGFFAANGDLTRFDITGSSTDYLAGNGTWQTIPTSTTDSNVFETVFRTDTAKNNIYNYIATKGAGSVTTVTVSPQYGVTASVANATTTPTITIGIDSIKFIPFTDTGKYAGVITRAALNTAISGFGSGSVTTVTVTPGYGMAGSTSNPTTTPDISINIDSTKFIPFTDSGKYWGIITRAKLIAATSAQTLQTVTDNGNTTTNSIAIQDGSGGNCVTITNTGTVKTKSTSPTTYYVGMNTSSDGSINRIEYKLPGAQLNVYPPTISGTGYNQYYQNDTGYLMLMSDTSGGVGAYPRVATASYVTTALTAIQTQTVTAASYTTSVTPTTTSTNIAATVRYVITAQAGALLFNNPSGTWSDGQLLIIRIKDNGTARALTYGTKYRGTSPSIPSTTIINETLYEEWMYNSTDDKWDLLGFVYAY